MGPVIGIPLFLIAVLVVLFVGATLLRAAVALANTTIGPVKLNASIAWDWEAADDDDDLEELTRKSRAIPEPGLGQGMAILLVAGIIHFVIVFVLENVFVRDRDGHRGDLDEWGPPYLLGTALGFAVTTTMVASMLPTTGKRASLATFFFYLICVAVVALIWGVIYFVLGSLR
jgi:hypothetical protein